MLCATIATRRSFARPSAATFSTPLARTTPELIELQSRRVVEEPDLVARPVEARHERPKVPRGPVDSVDQHDLHLREVRDSQGEEPALRLREKPVRLIDPHLPHLGSEDRVVHRLDDEWPRDDLDADGGLGRRGSRQVEGDAAARATADPVVRLGRAHDDGRVRRRAADDLVRLEEAIAVQVGEEGQIVDPARQQQSVVADLGDDLARTHEFPAVVAECRDQERVFRARRDGDPSHEAVAVLRRVLLFKDQAAGALPELGTLHLLFVPPLQIGAAGRPEEQENDRQGGAKQRSDSRRPGAGHCGKVYARLTRDVRLHILPRLVRAPVHIRQ